MRGMTITQVAAEAGVGVGTVSRVLNGSPSVSADTRARVLEAIAVLDYQPSPTARALSTGRTNTIGVVAPFFTQPSVIERLRGISHRLASEDYQLILHDVERPDQRRDLFRALAARGRIDGLLAISLAPTEREARRLQRAGVPTVLLDRAHPTLPCITIDDTEGGRIAAEHLLALGHRRIAFLGDEEANLFGFDSSARRREGFEAALADAGARPAPEWVLRRPHGRDAARVAASELLARSPRPTAVFAASDVQAIGVLEAAQAAGMPVPEELSVIGFDDVEAAGYTGLTTVAQPLEEIGVLGADLLLRAVSGEDVQSCRMPLEIVERGSTAPVAAISPERGSTPIEERSDDRRGGVHL
jgi:LacI family transcriptional regulator, galactose operon repressor